MAMVLLAGCASLEEAYYVDREFGQAQMASWDSQVAYPDYRFAAKTPQNIDGITAEEIMNVYNKTFAKEPTQTEVFQFEITQ
jgi:hypothetical protein